MDDFIMSFEPMLRNIALKYRGRLVTETDDLVQEGLILTFNLVEKLNTFDNVTARKYLTNAFKNLLYKLETEEHKQCLHITSEFNGDWMTGEAGKAFDPFLEERQRRERERNRNYYKAHREERLDYQRRYNETHKEQISERYQERKEEIRKRQKQYKKNYYQEHKEQIIARAKKYQQEHKEQILEYQQQYRERNRRRHRELCREYYQKNRQKILEHKRKYRETHRDEMNRRCRERYQQLKQEGK